MRFNVNMDSNLWFFILHSVWIFFYYGAYYGQYMYSLCYLWPMVFILILLIVIISSRCFRRSGSASRHFKSCFESTRAPLEGGLITEHIHDREYNISSTSGYSNGSLHIKACLDSNASPPLCTDHKCLDNKPRKKHQKSSGVLFSLGVTTINSWKGSDFVPLEKGRLFPFSTHSLSLISFLFSLSYFNGRTIY